MKRWVWSLFILALLSALPLVVRTQFYLHIFILTFLYASFANSWNLIGGYAGQLSLGHAAFFGIGAYACAIGSVKFGIS
ncbi:MAG: branched-chain amino acid ABC transporter ATP-binding protein, partial [Synergistales bacterium]|nr:branched-chain amino acid ABC transporter ATP-binding protein [Synergistales bacterium]